MTLKLQTLTTKAHGRTYGGATLIEVVIAAALIFLILSLIGHLSVTGATNYQNTTEGNSTFRKCALALERLQRELTVCRQILSPISSEIYQYQQPLVFTAYMPSSAPTPLITVSYRLNPSTHCLERALYEPDYTPGNRSSQHLRSPYRIVADHIDLFGYKLEPQDKVNCNVFISIKMSVSLPHQPAAHHWTISSGVRIQQQ